MAATMRISPSVPTSAALTVLLGAGTGSSNNYSTTEEGKFAKLSAESRYVLGVAGDPIEAVISAVEAATVNGYTVGGVIKDGELNVTFDGLEATAGTGTLAVGDYVVCGTAVAKGTALTVPPCVCKATNQPTTAIVSVVGTADTAAAIKTQIDAVLVKLADAAANALYAWRVVSLGSAGTGAVGTTGVISRENA